MRTMVGPAIILTLGLVLASCSGDDDSDGETTTQADDSAAVETDVPATKPTAVPDTTAAPTTAAATTTTTTTIPPPPVVEPIAIDLPDDLGAAGAVALIPAQSGRGNLLIGYAQDERRPTQPRIWENADGFNWNDAPAPTPPDDQTLLNVTGATWLGSYLAVGGSSAAPRPLAPPSGSPPTASTSQPHPSCRSAKSPRASRR